jgi:hypothetical protein
MGSIRSTNSLFQDFSRSCCYKAVIITCLVLGTKTDKIGVPITNTMVVSRAWLVEYIHQGPVSLKHIVIETAYAPGDVSHIPGNVLNVLSR